MKINYEKLTEITVKSQEELNDIPIDFGGRIYIEFGTIWNKAVVSKRYRYSVVLRENSSAELWENSSAELWGNSSADASGNTQIVDRQTNGRIEITGNARIVYMPKTIDEYCSFYGIKHNKKKGLFFKCVHKKEDGYYSDQDKKFKYTVGKKALADKLDTNPDEECGHGIHIAHIAWVLDYGKEWEDLAILEVEADLDSIVIPSGGLGKIRCAEVTVIREVPLEECGLYGKILAKRRMK